MTTSSDSSSSGSFKINTAAMDTSLAVQSRMKELDGRMALLLEKVRSNTRDPSKWTLSSSSSSSSSNSSNKNRNDDGGSRSTSVVSAGTTTTTTGDQQQQQHPSSIALSNVEDVMVQEWSRKLEESKAAIMKTDNNNKDDHDKDKNTNKKKALSIKDVEQFCFCHSEWRAIPKYATEVFLESFKTSLISDVGPLLPQDFVVKNRMYPKMRTASSKEEAAKSKELENIKFVRDSAGSLFACCGGESGGAEEYQRAVNNYNANFVECLLIPETEVLKKKSPTDLGEMIVWRGRVLLESVKQEWLPSDIVCHLAVSVLQSVLSQYPTSQNDLNKLIRDFNALRTKRVGGRGQQQNRSPSGGAASGSVVLTAVVVSGADQGEDQQQQHQDLWTIFESFLHILVTAHFHCPALYQRHYPKYLNASSAYVISKIRRLVWGIRKNILTRCASLWCTQYAVSAVERLVDEASTNAVIKITGTENTIKLQEPSQPFRPTREDVANELNKFLDGFIERYRELVGAVVRLSRTTTSTASTSSSSSKNNNNNESTSCCQYCTRGLHTAISKIVPETSDQVLTKTLQNRLRQKLIVAFACDETDREIVRDILSETAEKVWKISVGSEDLSKIEESYEKERKQAESSDSANPAEALLASKARSNFSSDDASNNNNSTMMNGAFSPAEKDDNNNSPSQRQGQQQQEPSSSMSLQEEKMYEVRFHNARSIESMAKTLEHARNRVVWQAAAEMTRVTDAITEVVVSKRCPKALLAFNNSIVRQCAAAAHTHLLLQSQSLLTAKELARIAERLCDIGTAAGGPTATEISKNSAQVIEIQRTLDQMEALLNRFPREAQETPNPEFDLDSDDDVGGGGGADSSKKRSSSAATTDNWDSSRNSSFANKNHGSNNNNNDDDMSNVFAQMAKVMPLYRMKQSWEIYNQFVKSL